MRPHQRFRLLVLLSTLLFGTTGMPAQSGLSGVTALPEGLATALAIRESGVMQADALFWRSVAASVNDPLGMIASVQSAFGERQRAISDLETQYQARLFSLQYLGSGPYAPTIVPVEFSSSVTHPYWPLVVGQTRIYERVRSEGVERFEATTGGVRVVDGVACRTVEVLESLNGELVEHTFDWFAQHTDGTVWFFGESARHYEEGFLIGIEGSWRAGRNGARPGIVMPGSFTSNLPYRQEYEVGTAEDVARIVATGETVVTALATYTNCTLIEEWSPLERERELKYFAPGVGFVLEINPATGARLELIGVVNN